MINTLLTALALGFHTLATIVLIGHYFLLTLVYLPVFRRSLDDKSMANTLAGIATGIRPLMLKSLIVFAITGIYLMIGNKAYLGVGQFGNAWSVLMLAKHFVILVFVVLGFRLNTLMLKATENRLPNLTTLMYATFACGLLVILLTALAQAL